MFTVWYDWVRFEINLSERGRKRIHKTAIKGMDEITELNKQVCDA